MFQQKHRRPSLKTILTIISNSVSPALQRTYCSSKRFQVFPSWKRATAMTTTTIPISEGKDSSFLPISFLCLFLFAQIIFYSINLCYLFIHIHPIHPWLLSPFSTSAYREKSHFLPCFFNSQTKNFKIKIRGRQDVFSKKNPREDEESVSWSCTWWTYQGILPGLESAWRIAFIYMRKKTKLLDRTIFSDTQ